MFYTNFLIQPPVFIFFFFLLYPDHPITGISLQICVLFQDTCILLQEMSNFPMPSLYQFLTILHAQ